MRFLAILALPLLVLLALPGLAQTDSASAPRTPATLDELFDKLQETSNPIEARQLERKIWETWGKSESDTLEALMQGGIAVMEKGDYKRAQDIFSTMIELKPDFAEAYNKRATVRFLAGDYAGSVADIERTLKLEPRHFGALSGLGAIMERLDNLPEALRAYRRALAANPHLADGPEKLKELRRRIDAKTL
ncbi:tetratricopeptide repeat protein [Ferrovibrio sp.]|uniref:tetratricopeptide repeat protein n=1 Tax=Ferrovibrio sp. TaxID=1917215 RepID=UPI002606F811|nr:tetratricopeptide repeat protein [Ferrovibrio sp.]